MRQPAVEIKYEQATQVKVCGTKYILLYTYIYIYQHLAGGLNQGLRGPGSRNKEGQWCYVLCSFMSEHQECTVIVYPSMVAASTQLRFSQSIPE